MRDIICDFCKSKKMRHMYSVPNTVRGMEVYICSICGLCQSIQTKEKPKAPRVPRTSSGPNFGNIRYGKSVRFHAAGKNILKTEIDWSKIKTVFDMGSNRGDFVLWMQENYPKIPVTGIEPDALVIDDYKNVSQLNLIIGKLETLDLPDDAYDFVYSSHTLEHASSASEMLNKTVAMMHVGAVSFLEVPNIDVIVDKDVVEEFFVDKHTYHFNRSLLIQYLEYLGCKIIYGENATDVSNITLVFTKMNDNMPAKPFAVKNPELVKHNISYIKKYVKILDKNREKVKKVAEKLYTLTEKQKVAFWGGGRIFDALVQFGNFKTDKLMCVVDTHLAKRLPEVHGVSLKQPNYLRIAQPDVIVILAKNLAPEIAETAKSYGFNRLIKFEDLITSV